MTSCATVDEFVVTGGVAAVKFVAGGSVVLQDKASNVHTNKRSLVTQMVSCFNVSYFIFPLFFYQYVHVG